MQNKLCNQQHLPRQRENAAYRSLGLQAGFGDQVDFALFDDIIEFVARICESCDLDLATGSINEVKAEDFAFPTRIVIPAQVSLDRHPGFDGPSVLVGVQAVDGNNPGWGLIASYGRVAGFVVRRWLTISSPMVVSRSTV